MKGRRNWAGSGHLHFERRVRTREDEQELPEIGSYLIYNDTTKNDSPGQQSFSRNERAICKVLAYYDALVLVEKYNSPQYNVRSCLQISDILFGIVKYRLLTDYVFTYRYSYDDLDINHLHPDISSLLVHAYTKYNP